jgi:hypothetical protein
MGLALGLAASLLLTMGLVSDVCFDNSRIGSVTTATFQGDFTQVASMATALGDPAVAARNRTAMAAAGYAMWQVPQGSSRATLRFRTSADADESTVRAVTFRARANPGDYDDDGSLAYQWALTGGTQVAALGGFYCDTGTATAYALAGGIANTVQSNWIYEYEIDLRGVSWVAFYRTDATANITVRVDAGVQ